MAKYYNAFSNINMIFVLIFIASCQYNVEVMQRDTQPILSYLVQNNSYYKQVFNPTWV